MASLLSTNSFDVSTLDSVTSNALYNIYKTSKTEAGSELYQTYGEDELTFSDIFDQAMNSITETNNYLSDFENEEIKWAMGESENTHDLQIALQKAQTALQYTVAVRDRIITAYREITQMQI